MRTTLLARSVEQVEELARTRRNERYLPGVELPRELKVRALGARDDQFSRPDLVFLAVPSKRLNEALGEIRALGVSEDAGMVSLAKGLAGPDGTPPAVALEAAFGAQRMACVGGPAHALEMLETGPGSSAPRARRRSPTGWPRPSSGPEWCARCRTTPSGWSWPGWRRTPRPWRSAPHTTRA